MSKNFRFYEKIAKNTPKFLNIDTKFDLNLISRPTAAKFHNEHLTSSIMHLGNQKLCSQSCAN